MRAVLDVNVLVAALVGRRGVPARLVVAWLDGRFELVVSELLLDELSRALGFRKVLTRVGESDASAFIHLLRRSATLAPDPPNPPRVSPSANDDYLLALARTTSAILVSGDRDLLSLAPKIPVLAPAEFVSRLEG